MMTRPDAPDIPNARDVKGQMPLDLSPDPDLTLSSFLDGPNCHEALSAVLAFPNWPAPWLFISGPEGSGKTHLGQGWAAKHEGVCLRGAEAALWPGLDKGPPVFLDYADRADETALFALANLALNGEISGLLLCAETPPESWDIAMPDLRSRLKNIPLVKMDLPGEEMLEPIIRKMFADRGREVRATLVSYIAAHCERSPKALIELVRELDIAASAAKRDLTRSFAADFLNSNSK